MFHKILVCSDLTDLSLPALRLALTLSQVQNIPIVCLHVLTNEEFSSQPMLLEGPPVPSVEEPTALVTKAWSALQEQVNGAQFPVRVQLVVRAGPLPIVVSSTADQLQADVIVIARGRGGVLGSGAEQIVRLRGRQVLVAPSPGEELVCDHVTLPSSSAKDAPSSEPTPWSPAREAPVAQ